MKKNAASQAETRAKILSVMVEMYEENGDVPSSTKIAARCGIDRNTVSKYRREINITEFFPTLRTRTFEILEGLAKKAIGGDPTAVKVWLQFVEGWKEETKQTQAHALSPEIWAELERLKGMK